MVLEFDPQTLRILDRSRLSRPASRVGELNGACSKQSENPITLPFSLPNVPWYLQDSQFKVITLYRLATSVSSYSVKARHEVTYASKLLALNTRAWRARGLLYLYLLFPVPITRFNHILSADKHTRFQFKGTVTHKLEDNIKIDV
jgi:hypothetical protein